MGAHDCFLAGTTRILKIWVVKGSEVQIRCQEKIVRAGCPTRAVQVGVRKCSNDFTRSKFWSAATIVYVEGIRVSELFSKM